MEFDQEKMEKNCLYSAILLGVIIYPGFLWTDIKRGNFDQIIFLQLKGTVSEISIDPQCKDGNARRNPWNLILIKKMWKIQSVYFCKFLHCFFLTRNAQVSFAENSQMKVNSLRNKNIDIANSYLVRQSFRG